MNADPIIEALEQQVACCQRLAKLCELQHQYVQQGQTEALLELLTRRQTELDDLTRLEQIVAPAKREWSQYTAALAASERERGEALLAQTRALLELITSADHDDALVLQQRKLNVGRQLNQASAARQINRNYAAAAYGPRASNLDLKK